MTGRHLGAALALLAGLLLAHAALAQGPFGIALPDSPSGAGFGGPLGPVFAWIAARQAEFYRSLTAALGATRQDGTAVFVLLGLSFAYGVFHAAGPGHGKAVITSYLVASGETVRRGVAVSFAAAFVQAASAIAIVAVAAAVLNATARTMTEATVWLEAGSYAAIAAVGAWLVWSKARGGHHHHHHHHHHDHDCGHGRHAADGHAHDHDHGHGDAGAAPAAVAAGHPRNRLVSAWSAILAVGIRPCSGAIIVLVFALSQGLFAAGVAATLLMALGTGLAVAALAALAVSAKGVALRLAGTESRLAAGLLRAIEIGGALAVLLFGLLLLGGALAG